MSPQTKTQARIERQKHGQKAVRTEEDKNASILWYETTSAPGGAPPRE